MDRATLDPKASDRRRIFEGEPPTMYLALAAGESVPAHDHPGRTVVCHVLEGELVLELDGETHRCSAGDVARFAGERTVEPRAETDVRALLVLAPSAD